MKLRKGAFVSVIAADIALALISVQGNKVNADTVTSNVKKENAVTVYSSNNNQTTNAESSSTANSLNKNISDGNNQINNVKDNQVKESLKSQKEVINQYSVTSTSKSNENTLNSKVELVNQAKNTLKSENSTNDQVTVQQSLKEKDYSNMPTAWIKLIDEDNNDQKDAYALLFDNQNKEVVKEAYTESGVPVYTPQGKSVYSITAPEGYYFDTDYFAPSDPNADNYDKIRSPYYSNITKNSIDFDFKHAMTIDGNLTNPKLKSDTFNLWIVKNGQKPLKSLKSDKSGQREERIDWYSNDSGEFVGSQKFYTSDSDDADMSKAYEVTAPEGYYFYTDYDTEFGFRTPTSGYVYKGNNYYPPIDLTGQTPIIIDGKKCYKKGIFHVYDAVKEGYFNKDNSNCNSTSLHIFRLWLFDPNYKSDNAAPLRDNGSIQQLGGAEVKYYDSNTNKELTDYTQIYNGKIGSSVKYEPVLPTMSNTQWVIDGNKTDVESIPTSLTLSTNPTAVKIYVMRKDNTSVIKFYGDDGLAHSITLDGKSGDELYVRDKVLNELVALAEKGYKLPAWYSQNDNVIEATSTGAQRVTAYGEVPEYIKLVGTTDIYNSYKNVPVYIKVEKAPKDLQYFVVKYVDEKGNVIKNTKSQIFYNYDKDGKLSSLNISKDFYSVPTGYDYITGELTNYDFNNNTNHEVLITAHKKELPKNTWKNENGKLYYYDKDGNLVHDIIQQVNGNMYSFALDGSVEKNVWREKNGKKYYFGWNGAAYSNCLGSVSAEDHNVYSFASDGSIEKNVWREKNGKKYYFGWNGVAYRNCLGSVSAEDHDVYSFASDGSIEKNVWREKNGKKYYFGWNGVAYRNCLGSVSAEDHNVYSFASDGSIEKNVWREKNGKKYYFGWNGVAYRNCLGSVSAEDHNVYSFASDGSIEKNVWREKNGKKYYFGWNGVAYRNCLGSVSAEDHNVYSFASDGSIEKNVWREKNGKKYYFGWNGVAYRNCLGSVSAEDHNVYSFASDGSIEKNVWREKNGKKYYFGWNGVAYRNCIAVIDGQKYQFNNDGNAIIIK